MLSHSCLLFFFVIFFVSWRAKCLQLVKCLGSRQADSKLSELSADNKPNGPSPLQSGGCGVHVFQKQFQILIRLTTEHFYILPQSIFNELWLREDGRISGSWHSELCSQTGISGSFPELMLRFLRQNYVSFYCCAVGLKISQRFSVSSLAPCKNSPGFLNLLMILRTVDNEIFTTFT